MPLIPLLSAKILAPVVAAGALSTGAAAHTTAAGTLPPDLPTPSALVSATSPSSPRAGRTFAGLPSSARWYGRTRTAPRASGCARPWRWTAPPAI